MNRLAWLAVPALALACAQVLSYDEYTARPADAGPSGDSAVTDSSGDGVVVDAAAGPARPPTRPEGLPATPSGKGRTLWVAVKRIYIGSMTSLGVSSDDAWREWGYDLDHVCTSLEDSKTNIGTCRRHPEAKQDFLEDGDLCRDNNFGHHVVALLNVSSDGFEKRVNEGILEGNTTWLFRISDVDDGANDGYAPAKLYRAQGVKMAGFKWDGTDVRKVLTDSVVGGDLEKPFGDFPKGYIKDDVWVSGEPALHQLGLPGSGSLSVALTLDSAVLTMQLAPDHKSGTRGLVVGAIPVGSIENLLRPLASESGFCPGTALYSSLLRTVQRFPDVSIGAPNLLDTTKECDGISIGLGFDVANVQPATELVPPDPPGKDLCADAGPG